MAITKVKKTKKNITRSIFLFTIPEVLPQPPSVKQAAYIQRVIIIISAIERTFLLLLFFASFANFLHYKLNAKNNATMETGCKHN